MKYDVEKLRWSGFLLALVMTVVLAVSAAVQYVGARSFQPVQARLVRVDARYGTNSDTRMTLYKTAYYEYTVGEQSYVSPQAILPVSFRKVGAEYTVRYNPENPAELQDLYQWYTTLGALAVLALASLGLGKLSLPGLMGRYTGRS